MDAVIAVTEQQTQPLAALGYRREGIEVIANGVFTSAGEAPAPADGGFVALCVAGLRPEKRVDVFIRAVAAARRERPEIAAAVAGEGPERERLPASPKRAAWSCSACAPMCPT